MSRTRVYEWHKRFKSGRDDVEDDLKPEHLTTFRNDENIQNVNELVHSNRRMTVRMLAEELGLRTTILTENLGMVIICLKMVSKLISDDEKTRCVDLSRDVLERLEGYPELLNDVTTGDTTWVIQHDPETKRQSLQWKTAGSTRQKKAACQSPR